MTKALILLVPTLALIPALSCRRQSAHPQDAIRTSENARIATRNRSSQPGDNKDRPCVNLNTAGPDTLMSLPGIGPGLADKIIEYRAKYGPFQRAQDIIIINGFGERRYHRIEPYVCVY
jgi:competence ComEA-like helix-hairpin-helix protein